MLTFFSRLVVQSFELLKNHSGGEWFYGSEIEYHCSLAKGFYDNATALVDMVQIMDCQWNTTWLPATQLKTCVCKN